MAAARSYDGINDHGEAGHQQHHVRCCPGSICRARDGDTGIGLFQRRRIVHTITGHAQDVAIDRMAATIIMAGIGPQK